MLNLKMNASVFLSSLRLWTLHKFRSQFQPLEILLKSLSLVARFHKKVLPYPFLKMDILNMFFQTFLLRVHLHKENGSNLLIISAYCFS